jgi:N-formylglutamate deformylase
MEPVTVAPGTSPLVLAMPHTGTWLPAEIWSKLNDRGRRLADTDWHIDRLYEGLVLDATVVKANFHRYVIDANRDPAGASLYPGQNTTGLCPTTDFDGRPLYEDGQEPDEIEVEHRRSLFHAPYHAALAAELARVRSEHGVAVLYDCHSIRSLIPFLFDGTLPDFNIGTNDGVTCAPQFQQAVTTIAGAAPFYSNVVNGRFKGGWTTRHYGRPETGVQAIQMELAQSTHLESEAAPFAYDEAKAARLRPILQSILETLVVTARALSAKA